MMLLMLLGVIQAPALEIYRDVPHTRAYASIRGRWNAGVAIKLINPPHLAGVLDSRTNSCMHPEEFTSSPLLRWPPTFHRPARPMRVRLAPDSPNLIL